MTTHNRARRLVAAIAALVAGSGVAGAQAATGPAVLTGSVRSEQGQPLPNANVFITELGISVGTNAGGVYTITIPVARVSGQAATLRARIFGYTPEARPIRVTAGTQRIDFNLKQDVNRLSAVVVTGVTGATETTKLPISVSQVDAKDMPVPGTNALSQLQGKVPGVQIVSPTGRPGGSPAILLRGPQSINASGRSQSPLYIVDGVVISGGMPDLNPLDIESIEVVKGAAASSLYGSRAGNGVINIRTKSGKNANDGVRFNARAEYGQGDVENEYRYAKAHFLVMDETRTRFCVAGTNCASTVDLEEEALRINQNGGDFALSPVNFQGDAGIATGLSKPLLRGTFSANRWPREYDPISAFVNPGQFAQFSLDATGRVGGTSFFASASNLRQQGAMRFLEGYTRQSLRLNLDQSIGTDWTFGLRTYYSRSEDKGGGNDQGGAAFFRLTRVPAGINLLRRDQYGRLFVRSNPLAQGIQNENPLYWFDAVDIEENRNRFLGNATAQYTPFAWLTLDANLSYDRLGVEAFNMRDKGFRGTFLQPNLHGGLISEGTDRTEQYNVATNATARRTWGDLETRWNARYIYEQEDGRGIGLSGSILAAPGLRTSTAVADQNSKSVSSSEYSVRSIGLMTGLDLTYKERYIVSGLVRRDGSSLFGSANRWATYGRGSLAWRLSQEPWWFAPGAMNEFKLRGSLGTAGGRPPFVAQYETFTIGAAGALVPAALGNKSLRPETVTETELGLDAEFWSRVGLNVNYAQSVSKDQILPVPPSVSSGFTNQWKNAGTLQNKTWEASLNIPLVQRRNLNWTARLNYDQNRAVITKLDVPEFFGGVNQQGGEGFFKFAQGERYGAMYGRAYARNCSDLGPAFAAQCGGAGSMFQKNDDGLIVWTGGQSLGAGITQNLWQAVNPGCTKAGAPIDVIGEVACRNAGGTVTNPFGVPTNWGLPIIIRDSTGTARQMKLGHATPDFRVSASQTFNYKKVFVYALLDGSFGQKVYNLGRAWSFGDYMTRDTDQLGESVETAKPMGYYWRATRPDNGSGIGGMYDVLGPNNVNVEDASYAKLREVNLSYNVGSVRGVGDWTVSLIGRNLKTFTNYKGFDPEVGRTGGTTGSAVINSIDAYSFPNLRTFTLALNTRF